MTDLNLEIEPAALAAARRSVDESGFLLLGEVHGARENPLVIRSVMRALGISGLALEWHEGMTAAIGAFIAGGPLADHPLLWFGDGRVTGGHLAVLRERAAHAALSVALFDGTIPAEWDWSQQDEAMAERILAAPAAEGGTLVVAGNAHTPTTQTRYGTPLGKWLAAQRPGVREIRIIYYEGRFYNREPRQFDPVVPAPRRARLREEPGGLVLDLPAATEATVPERPMPWPV